MNKNNLKNYILDNGLKLEFIDHCKEICINIFYICISIHIIVPVERKWFRGITLSEITFTHIANVLKNRVIFEQKHERNFIEASLKEKSINSIITGVLSSSAKYLGHQDFPGKLILKCFREKNKGILESGSDLI